MVGLTQLVDQFHSLFYRFQAVTSFANCLLIGSKKKQIKPDD